MSTAFTHLALHVRDLDACVRFYQSYAQMRLTHDRVNDGKRIVWLAEPGKETEFIIVLIPGGPGRDQISRDFSHLGFALESKEAVDAIADKARAEGILEWNRVKNPFLSGITAASGIRTEISLNSVSVSRWDQVRKRVNR